MSDRPPREFIPVEAAEIPSMLREAVESRASVLFWIKDQEPTMQTHLVMQSTTDRALTAAFPKDFDLPDFESSLARAPSRDLYFSLSLLRANVFFRAAYLGSDPVGIQVSIPDRLFKVQRRADLRLVIPNEYTLKAEFQDPLFTETRATRKIYDLSSSGCSLVLDPDERAVYQLGLILRGFRLKIRDRWIETSAEVRYAGPFSLGSKIKGVKLGLQFGELSAEDARHLTGYVLEESRRHYLKFV